MWVFQLFRLLGGAVLAAFGGFEVEEVKIKTSQVLGWGSRIWPLPSWIYKSWQHPHLENVASHEISCWTSLSEETWKLLVHYTYVFLIKPMMKKHAITLARWFEMPPMSDISETLHDTSTLYSVNNRILADHTLKNHGLEEWICNRDLLRFYTYSVYTCRIIQGLDSVVSKHGLFSSPTYRVVGPFPSGLLMASKWGWSYPLNQVLGSSSMEKKTLTSWRSTCYDIPPDSLLWNKPFTKTMVLKRFKKNKNKNKIVDIYTYIYIKFKKQFPGPEIKIMKSF